MPVGGGPVLQVADIGGNPRGGAWAPDGTIVFAAPQTAGLSRVSGSGGKPTPLTTLDKARGEHSHRWPDMLPGGKWVLFTVGLEDAPYDEARIEAVSLETGERRRVIASAGFARYFPDGRLLFVRGGHVHAVGFDRRSSRPCRERRKSCWTPFATIVATAARHLAVSASGVLVYGPVSRPPPSTTWRGSIETDGSRESSDTPRPFRNVRVSPGRHAASRR